MFPELHSGMRAFFDSMGGLVPVHVERITHWRTGHTETRPSSEHNVTVRVLKDVQGYKKGETLTEWSLRIIPPGALKHGRYCLKIGFYTVKADDR